MTTIAKQKVKDHLATEYGKQMVKIHGLKYVKKEMEDVYQFKCPIKVDVETGNNWGELK